MNCEQSWKMFDAYLDGTLPEGLAAEFATHRLKCAECRHELALLEVSSQIIAADHQPDRLSSDFTDRLLSIIEVKPKPSWLVRNRSRLTYGGLATAAGLALVVTLLPQRTTRVAGERVSASDIGLSLVTSSASTEDDLTPTIDEDDSATDDVAVDPVTVAVDRWMADTRAKMEDAGRGNDPSAVLDMTVLQLLDVLRGVADPRANLHHFPGSESERLLHDGQPRTSDVPVSDVGDDGDELEDL